MDLIQKGLMEYHNTPDFPLNIVNVEVEIDHPVPYAYISTLQSREQAKHLEYSARPSPDAAVPQHLPRAHSQLEKLRDVSLCSIISMNAILM